MSHIVNAPTVTCVGSKNAITRHFYKRLFAIFSVVKKSSRSQRWRVAHLIFFGRCNANAEYNFFDALNSLNIFILTRYPKTGFFIRIIKSLNIHEIASSNVRGTSTELFPKFILKITLKILFRIKVHFL